MKLSEIDLRVFVPTWQNSESPKQVARVMGMESKDVQSTAQILKKKGVKLKIFRPRVLTEEFVVELQELAENPGN